MSDVPFFAMMPAGGASGNFCSLAARHMTSQDLGKISTGAASLWQRLDWITAGIQVESEPERARALIERWQDTLGGVEPLERRLRLAGLTREQVERALGTFGPTPADSLPRWTATLQAISDIAKRHLASADAPGVDPTAPVPFEDLLVPAVTHAAERLRRTQGHGQLSPRAQRSLDRQLLIDLAQLSARVLEHEFSKVRPEGLRLLALLSKGRTTFRKDRYNAFVQRHLGDGLETLCRDYPVYARLLAEHVDRWVEAHAEFLGRTASDMELFGETGISSVETGLSDPHHGHRTVMAVEFTSGRRVVYKPRDVGTEEGLAATLARINDLGFQPRFRTFQIWNRGDYGWVEFVPHAPCTEEAAARRFYERAGALLCLLYVIQATDCHRENIVADGEHPVLVDAEALVQPLADLLDRHADPRLLLADADAYVDSVASTGLLPWWEVSPGGGTGVDISGLALPIPQRSLKPVRVLKGANTDDMHYVHEHIEVPPAQNVPRLTGDPIRESRFVEEITQGFSRLYSWLLEHRQVLASQGWPPDPLRRQRVRFVFRATRFYHALLVQSREPGLLSDGARYSMALDAISRPFLPLSDSVAARAVLAAEIQALEQGDIPYFSAVADQRSLDGDVPEPLPMFFRRSGWDRVTDCARRMGAEDLSTQLSVIRGSMAARATATELDPGSLPASVRLAVPPDLSAVEPLTPGEMLHEAERIAHEIAARAIRTADGRRVWLGITQIPGTALFRFQPLGENLYEGRGGIALFLAALDHLTERHDYGPLIDDALAHVRQCARERTSADVAELPSGVGLGGVSGLPGIVYALVCISKLQGRPELLDDAHGLARMLSAEMIDRDRTLDVMGGAAGTILGLLALHRVSPRDDVLETAIRAGDHLLQQRVSADGLPRAWVTLGPRPLTGFAHGAAGVVNALAKLFDSTRDHRYLDAACEGVAYERALFSKEAGNWPDLRETSAVSRHQDAPQALRCGWCHGATGIGLARLGCSRVLDASLVSADIDAAVTATMAASLDDDDHLCCGNFGRLELLAAVSGREPYGPCSDDALRRARVVVERAQRAGAYRIVGSAHTERYSPAFFRGTAGIGYALLGMACPGRLPSVLMLGD